MFVDGWVEVKDAGSQVLAALVGARRGQTIVNLCAGAGGKTLALAAALTGGLIQAHAQTAVPPAAQDPLTLRGAFEAAWARQPEALALATRRDAARAQAQAAQSWTPEPVAMELSTKTDRLNRNLGTREYEVGVAIPLWLPGERGRSQALADAEGRAVESRTTAAPLRTAAAVREAWGAWQRAHAELEGCLVY